MLTTKPRILLFCTLIAAFWPLNDSFELPFLKTCTIEDEKCHVEKVNKFLEMYANGIEELDVPTFDPLILGNITINGNSNENFNLNLFMENVTLHNFPATKCLSVKGFTKDPTKSTVVNLKLKASQIIVKGHCQIKGKILLFTLDGETDLKMDIRNITNIMHAKVSPYKKDDVTYYKVDDVKSKLNIESLKTSFTKSTLFNGEEVFMETFAYTINENWKVLYDEIEPRLSEAFSRVTLATVNKILPTIPYNKYFKESE